MSSSSLAGKTAVLTECVLLSIIDPSFSVDLRSFVAVLHIYEHIGMPTLSGELFLSEDIGLSRMLFGYEYVRVRFGVHDPLTNAMRNYPANEREGLVFRVVSQTDRQLVSAGTESYRLALVSPTLYTSMASRISRSYKNKKVEDIIRDILTNDVKTQRQFFAEATNQPTNFTIPYYSPLQAIEFFTSRAINTENRTTYFFYESLDGFHFASLTKMITDIKKVWNAKELPIVRKYHAGLTGERDTSLQIRAENIDVMQTFDMMNLASQGYFASRVVGVDILSGKFRDTIHTASEDTYLKKPRLNGGSFYAPMVSPTRPFMPDARVFVVPTTSISASNPAMKAIDPSIAENFIEATVDARNRELLELQTQCLRVKCSGAPNLNAGRGVYVQMTMPSTQGVDVMHSGLHLIVATKHTLLNNQSRYSYETTIEAYSDSINPTK